MYQIFITEDYQIPCVSKTTGITEEKLLRDFKQATAILNTYTLTVEGDKPSWEDCHIEPWEKDDRFCNVCGEFNATPLRVVSNNYPKIRMN